ncbi:MAG: hypothetical protein IJ756_05295 [Paludibacteraceae bacterium]|nr:hypothetical protein [Paludibacteraceae bacterium]
MKQLFTFYPHRFLLVVVMLLLVFNYAKAKDGDTFLKKSPDFKLEPTDESIVGIQLGYVSRQMRADGEVMPFLGGDKVLSHGVKVGLVINPTIRYGLGFRTGLAMDWVMRYHDKVAYNDINLSVPLQVSWRIEPISKFSIALFTGPVLDFDCFHGVKAKGHKLDKYDYWDGNKHYEGFNMLWGVGLAFQYKSVRLGIDTEWGMVNKHKNTLYDKVFWHKPLSVSITTFF